MGLVVGIRRRRRGVDEMEKAEVKGTGKGVMDAVFERAGAR